MSLPGISATKQHIESNMWAVMDLEHGHSPKDIAARLSDAGRPSYMKDMVLGGIDGAVTTFAIVAGVAGAALSAKIVLILGVANLVADGFSMAAGNYSGTKAERDRVQLIRQLEERHITLHPEGEREEVRQILALKGLSGKGLEDAVATITSDREQWVRLMLTDEHGLAPVTSNPLHAAIATFLAFAVCGAVPLLPYLLPVQDPFPVATLGTGVIFFAIGAAKSRFLLAPWWREGLETLAIGSAAAGCAYFIGKLLAGLA